MPSSHLTMKNGSSLILFDAVTKNGKNTWVTTLTKNWPDLPKDTLGAIELTQQARELLEDGKIEQAKAKFAQARELDASVVFGDEGL